MSTFDLDALEAEANASAFDFTLRGQVFALPAFGGIDYRALIDGETDASGNPTIGEMRRLLSLGLGEQWEAFDALPLSIAGLTAIFERWNAANPVDPGESEASPRS